MAGTERVPSPGAKPVGVSHRGTRTAAAILAACGCCIALYLALYQWHEISHVWDPLFRDVSGRYSNGSERVLNSWLSRKLPVSDAFIGALAYATELVAGLIGGAERSRAAPWAVLTTATVAALMALGSLALVMVQPTLIGSWCTLCLTSAAISFGVMVLVVPELRACIHHLRRARAAGRSITRAIAGSGSPNGDSPALPHLHG